MVVVMIEQIRIQGSLKEYFYEDSTINSYFFTSYIKPKNIFNQHIAVDHNKHFVEP